MQSRFINLLFGKRTASLFKKGFMTLMTTLSVIALFSQCSNAQDQQNTKKMKDKNPYYSTTETKKIDVSDAEWKEILDPEVYRIARESGTEYAHSGIYNKHFEGGDYHCRVCGNMLFKSDAKFASSCGWPSFFEAYSKESMKYIEDNSHGMHRIEVRCGRCDSHLGHIFNDGPPPTGKRYCINSKVILFNKDEKK